MSPRIARLLLVSVTLFLTTNLLADPPLAVKPAPTPAAKPHDFKKWEKAIANFEASDHTNPPPKNAVLFVGSSTIVRWKSLQHDFPGVSVINRGFGGNEICDSTHFADRMIFPYHPRIIFLRAGGNDIHAGKTPQQVFEDFKDFVKTIHSRLPETEIAFISLSPAISRWNERDADKEVNTLIADYIKSRNSPKLKYIDTWNIPLDPAGNPRPELFVADKLHFSDAGYKLLIERVRPYVPTTPSASTP